MALNSSNYDHALATTNNFGTTSTLPPISPPPGFPNPIYYSEEVNGVGQLGLSPRVTGLKTKSQWARANATENMRANETLGTQFSCPSPTPLDDTKNIMRASQIIRAQLIHAASYSSSSIVETEEKKKAREMLQAQLLLASALPPNNKDDVSGSTAKPTSIDMLVHASKFKDGLKTHRFDYNSNHSRFSQPIIDVDEGIEILCPPPLTSYFASETSNGVEIVSGDGIGDDGYDGRLHSLPYKKNGPYTCPKCNHVFATSQRFAAHVSSSHYKYETKAEKRKRLMAKIRGRSLRIHRGNDGLTFVPVSSASAAVGNNHHQNQAGARLGEGGGVARVKLEAVEVEGVEVAPPPHHLGKELIVAGGGVKIKAEPVDT